MSSNKYLIITEEDLDLKTVKSGALLGLILNNLGLITKKTNKKWEINKEYKDIIDLIKSILILYNQKLITSFNLIIDYTSEKIEILEIGKRYDISQRIQEIIEEYFRLLDATYQKNVFQQNVLYHFSFKFPTEDKPLTSLLDLREILYQDYLNGEGDFTIKTLTQEFKVHKLILRGLNSPYFDALLKTKMEENKNSILRLKDDSWLIRYIIDFAYLGKDKFLTKIFDYEDFPYMELFVLAKRFQIDALSNTILENINIYSTNTDLQTLKEYSELYPDDDYLKKIIKSFDGRSLEEFLKSSDNTIIREYYNPETDQLIIQDNYFAIKNPTKLYLGRVFLENGDVKYNFRKYIGDWFIEIFEDKDYPGVIDYYLNGYSVTKHKYYVYSPKGMIEFYVKESKIENIEDTLNREYLGSKVIKNVELGGLQVKFVSIFGILILEDVTKDYTIYYSSKYPEIKFYKTKGDIILYLISDKINESHPKLKKFFKKYSITNFKNYDLFQEAMKYFKKVEENLRENKKYEIIKLKTSEEFAELKLEIELMNGSFIFYIVFPKKGKPFIYWKTYNDIILANYISRSLTTYYPNNYPDFTTNDISKEEFNLMKKFDFFEQDINKNNKIKIISLKESLIRINNSVYVYYYNGNTYRYSNKKYRMKPKILRRILSIKSGNNPEAPLNFIDQKIYDEYVSVLGGETDE